MKHICSLKSSVRTSPASSRFSRGNAGYTLFEIMLVLGIISVLVGSAIYSLVGNLDTAKYQRVESDIKTIGIQLQQYEINNYALPSTEQGLQALVTYPSGDPVPRKWRKALSEVPLDPWGRPYVYRNPAKVPNDKGYDLYSDHKESADGGH